MYHYLVMLNNNIIRENLKFVSSLLFLRIGADVDISLGR